jgi:large subunit ribosomal protein L22
MEATAKLKFVRGSARKARLVLDTTRNKSVPEAQRLLKFSRRRSAAIINKLLDSAIANAQQKEPRLDLETMYVSHATADEGPQMKRYMPRAQGRAFMIRKPTCHIALKIASQEEEE